MGKGEWEIGNRAWGTGNGEWEMENRQWEIGNENGK